MERDCRTGRWSATRKTDKGSVFERTRLGYMWKTLVRPDWSVRERTRGIDWLGTTRSLARSHARTNCLSRTFYYEVTDTCVSWLVVCISFPEGSSGVVATNRGFEKVNIERYILEPYVNPPCWIQVKLDKNRKNFMNIHIQMSTFSNSDFQKFNRCHNLKRNQIFVQNWWNSIQKFYRAQDFWSSNPTTINLKSLKIIAIMQLVLTNIKSDMLA